MSHVNYEPDNLSVLHQENLQGVYASYHEDAAFDFGIATSSGGNPFHRVGLAFSRSPPGAHTQPRFPLQVVACYQGVGLRGGRIGAAATEVRPSFPFPPPLNSERIPLFPPPSLRVSLTCLPRAVKALLSLCTCPTVLSLSFLSFDGVPCARAILWTPFAFCFLSFSKIFFLGSRSIKDFLLLICRIILRKHN